MTPRRLRDPGRPVSVRQAYIEANIFELFVALLALTSSVSYFIDPHTAGGLAVSHVAFPDVAWAAMYGTGSFLVCLGLVTIRGQVEAAGLVLFAGAVVIQALAVASVGGWSSYVGVLILVSFAAASLTRLWVIVNVIRAQRYQDGER